MKQQQFFLAFSVCVLLVLGLVMIFSASSAEILDHSLAKSLHADLLKQMVSALGGWSLALVAWKVGWKRWLELVPGLYGLSLLLLALCFFPGIGRQVNGSARWISLFGLSLQPSEFVKFLLPLFLIRQLARSEKEMSWKRLLLHLGWALPPLLLILFEPNNGTVGVLLVSLVPLFFLAAIPAKFWAAPLFAFTLIALFSAYHLPYVRARLSVYWNPELDLQGRGHQPLQAKIAAGSGGLFGKGPGRSLQKFSYLPEAQNDYIAAIFAEEYGFLGTLGLILLYMLFTLCGLSIAYSANSLEESLIAALFSFVISFQAILNLGVVSGLLPSTGLNLPFFSQGGSSLMANMAAFGILLDVGERH